ncbi:unnamed protein product [Scytosiphon promiscuus]
MKRRPVLLWLIAASTHSCPAAAFAPVRPPATAYRPTPGSTSNPTARCSRCGTERNTPNAARRRRCPPTVLSAQVDETVATAAAAACEPAGSERAPHEPAVQAFETWTASAGYGGRSASLSHADFDGLRGVMTKAAIGPWEPIVTVPVSTILQEELLYAPSLPGDTTATADPGAAAAAAPPLPPPVPLSVEAWQRCPWWVRLGVRLLNEIAAGEGASLQEYVGMLPSAGETGTLVNWSAEQLDRLYYPRLLSQVKLQRRLFKGFQKYLLADTKRGGTTRGTGEADVSSPLVDALADMAKFGWALECVLSRAFQLPPEDATALVFGEDDDTPVRAPELTPPAPEATRMALLPLIDSINHYSRIPTHMYWEADGALSLSVGASFDPGDQAFVSYGPVSNDDLLQYYGFVERENPSDTYVLQDMGKWLREDNLMGADLSTRLLACPGAREAWRYLRRGVILRDAVHPSTMQAVRIVMCEVDGSGVSAIDDVVASVESKELRWDGTEADLERFNTPVSLVSEIATYELLMRYCAREADAWGEAGVAAALAEDPTAPGLDGDLDGLGLDADRRLMLSVFRQEKVALLRSIIGRLTHMRKVSDLLNRPIKMPVNKSPPRVLGPAVESLAED